MAAGQTRSSARPFCAHSAVPCSPDCSVSPQGTPLVSHKHQMPHQAPLGAPTHLKRCRTVFFSLKKKKKSAVCGMLGFVRGSCGNWLGWAGSEVADGYSKRARPVFRRVSARNSKPQLPSQLPGGDVTSEGQGRGDAVAPLTWGVSEDAVQMLRKLTGTRQWRWVRPRQRRTAHKIQLHVIRSQRGARPGALMALDDSRARMSIQVTSAGRPVVVVSSAMAGGLLGVLAR